jgi:phosphatidylserine synthase
VIVYATPLIAMTIAFLMVSRIPYRRFHRAYLLGRQPFGQFLFVMLLLAIFLAFKAETLLLIALWYGLSGPLFHVVRLVRERSRPRIATGGRAADDEEERRLA